MKNLQSVFLFSNFHNLRILGHNIEISVFFMRDNTIGTVFYSFFYIFEIASAFLPQSIKGTVTEKAVEKLPLRFVTRKINAVFILKI